MLRVVQVQHVHPIDTQRRQALLQRLPRPAGVEAAGLAVPVELGRKDAPLRPATERADHRPDALLAAPEPVVARAVEKAVRLGQHLPHGGESPFLGHVIAVGLGHAADAGGPEPDRGHPEPRVADLTLLRHASSPFFWFLPALVGPVSVEIDRLQQRKGVAARIQQLQRLPVDPPARARGQHVLQLPLPSVERLGTGHLRLRT